MVRLMHFRHGGLAGVGGTDDAEDRVLADLEIEAVEGDVIAVSGGDVAEFDVRFLAHLAGVGGLPLLARAQPDAQRDGDAVDGQDETDEHSCNPYFIFSACRRFSQRRCGGGTRVP